MGIKRVHLAIAALVAAIAAVVPIAISVTQRSVGIRLAYQNRVASAVVIVAVEQRFFAKEGLPIEAYRFNSGPACSEALASGSADIGTMGDTTAIIATSRGASLMIIASHGSGEHRHRIVVGGHAAIHKVTDLLGKRIGVKKGTSTYGGFLAFLAGHQLAAEGLQVIDMRPADMPEALAAGSVDAFVASEPTPSLAEVGGARELATLGGLGNTYPIMILARNELLARDPEKVQGFLRALRRAEAFIRDDPERATVIVAEVTGLPADVARRAMQRHKYTLCLDEAILASLRQTAEFLRAHGIIRQLPDLKEAAAAEYLTASLAQDLETG